MVTHQSASILGCQSSSLIVPASLAKGRISFCILDASTFNIALDLSILNQDAVDSMSPAVSKALMASGMNQMKSCVGVIPFKIGENTLAIDW